MDSRQRVLAALRGEVVDRAPISFWGHVYHRESSAQELVAHTMERWTKFEWDWVKLNPRKHYHVEPWGVRYDYPGVPDAKPKLSAYPVHQASDWDLITPVDETQGALGEQIEAVRLLRAALPKHVPILATIFTPLAILGELCEPPAMLREHLRTETPRITRALEVVTDVFAKLARAYMNAGADGIYLATVDWGCREFMTSEDVKRFSTPYDVRVLEAAGASPFHTLHVCKGDNLLAEFAKHPVGAWSWDAHAPGNLSLAQALEILPGAVMGGISHDGALQASTPEPAVLQFRRAREATHARRWLAAPGCSMPPTTPEANLEALRNEDRRVAESPGHVSG
jgi:uroporphyrinogen decarboxylase